MQNFCRDQPGLRSEYPIAELETFYTDSLSGSPAFNRLEQYRAELANAKRSLKLLPGGMVNGNLHVRIPNQQFCYAVAGGATFDGEGQGGT